MEGEHRLVIQVHPAAPGARFQHLHQLLSFFDEELSAFVRERANRLFFTLQRTT